MSRRIEWDSGVVAAGAVIDSPIFEVSDVDGLFIIADNSAGAATRNVTMDSYLGDGATIIDTALALRTVAAGAKERGEISVNGAGGLGTPALNFAFPITLPTKVRFHLVAGGAANGRLTVFGK